MPDGYGPRPTRFQLAWEEAGLSMFTHFGMNTFTNREWGEGNENPSLFNPSALDARQWAHNAKAAGFQYLIFTAKHHDGFCLWPSKYTDHSVKSSPWKNGKGDVVKEVSDACRQEKIKLGIYLSPWDRHEKFYGDSPLYNQFFVNQLTELMTQYGPVAEVWFDGACGEGPNGKKQVYDWNAYYAVIRKYQPDALIAIMGPDIRWVGNEDGFAHETEWCVQQRGDKKVWYPSECDVSIRPGWFWHKSENDKVKTLPQLLDIYFRSVGHNSNLLLNVPPDTRGLFADPDVQRLKEFRTALDNIFAHDLLYGAEISANSSLKGYPAKNAIDGKAESFWSPAKDGESYLEVRLRNLINFNIAMSQEYIAFGQRVEAYRLDVWRNEQWQTIVHGTTIGHTKLDRFPVVQTDRIRLVLESSLAIPQIRSMALYDSEQMLIEK
jgi:alpha-L-fucosidase